MLSLLLSLTVLAAPPQPTPPPPDAPAVQSGRAHVRGVELYYESRGTGPALILIHGGGGNGTRYADLATALARRFRVITPDMRGRGRSTDTDEPFSYEGMAKDVIALMDALKLRRVHVLGYSDGGIIGLELAMHFPERVDRVAAFGANVRPDGVTSKTRAWIQGLTPEQWNDDGSYAAIAPNPKHWPKVVEKLKTLWLTQPNHTAKELGRIRAKVLIGAGDHDEIRLDHILEIFNAIPGAELFILPGAGHSHRKQDPVLVERALLKFFND